MNIPRRFRVSEADAAPLNSDPSKRPTVRKAFTLAALVRTLAATVLVLVLLTAPPDGWLGATRSAAQVATPYAWVGAEAVAAAQGAPPVPINGGPYAALPPSGGSASEASATVPLDGMGTLELPGVSVDGGPTAGGGGSVTATASGQAVTLLGGRVRASSFRATASAAMVEGQARADGDVTVEGLVVDGTAYPSPALNQQIPLAGIGTLIVRERVVTVWGSGSAATTVRALRLSVSTSAVSGIPAGGEILLGSVTAGVPDVGLTPPREHQSAPATTPVLDAAVSTRGPINTNIRRSVVGNDNVDNGNSNRNDNDDADNSESPAPTTTVRSTQTAVVMTVIVIVATATPVPTP